MDSTSANAAFHTPMMKQYLTLKRAHQDCLLLFRLGDFYELFLDDAKLASEILGITLTARARGKDGKIPMAGVPHHAVTGYISKLVKAGHKVAICDQVSLPDGKSLVERKVIRVLSPGTIVDDLALEATSNNYLLSIVSHKKKLGLALVDVSTGELKAEQLDIKSTQQVSTTLAQVIAYYQPSEAIVSIDSNSSNSELSHTVTSFLEQQPNLFFHRLENWPSLAKSTTVVKKQLAAASLLALGISQQPAVITALGGMLDYLAGTQQSELPHLTSIQPILSPSTLQLDPSTISNLELIGTLQSPQASYSFLTCIDRSKTAAGGRKLKEWLLHPLAIQQEIEARLQAVAALQNSNLSQPLTDQLKKLSDVERTLSRLAIGLGTPKDLKSLEQSLMIVTEIEKILGSDQQAELLNKISYQLSHSTAIDLISKINITIKDEPATDPKLGGYVAVGINKKIDKLNATLQTQRKWMLDLETSQRQATGISSLKVRFNKVFGYYLEISKSNLDKVPDNYLRQQTLVNAERFITPELKEREAIILAAQDKIQVLEYQEFLSLVQAVLTYSQPLQIIANQVSTLDCLLSFATLAVEKKLTKPILTTNGKLDIKSGRHLIVEEKLDLGSFVPNDILLDTNHQQVALITGPNMAGKSVLMRQTALIVLLAHVGSFVPAAAAEISLTDRIFVRSGASDSISQGLSTFMVEMVETAYILHHLTEKSLVIMDEIGRGTSTYDGISIAWAIIDQLVAANAPHPKSLFATHYHELQALADKSDRIHNFHMAIDQQNRHDHSQPTFLYTLATGGAPASFGIAVAKMAGLPNKVIERASQILEQLENDQNVSDQPSSSAKSKKDQTLKTSSSTKKLQKLYTQLSSLPLEKTTPLEALNILAELQQKLKNND
jgi:DNA mismatch repair protein MutS